jgi:hypothetical protein
VVAVTQKKHSHSSALGENDGVLVVAAAVVMRNGVMRDQTEVVGEEHEEEHIGVLESRWVPLEIINVSN